MKKLLKKNKDNGTITLFCIRPKGFNIGNDAIYIGLQYFIYKAFGEVVNLIWLPATSRYETSVKAGLTPRTVYEINEYGHGVIVGGGNLYENGELEVNLNALKSLDVPMMLYSLSRGRIYNRQRQLVDRTDVMSDSIIKALDAKANYSLVRDEATYGYLKEIGCAKTVVGGCPTVYLNRMADRFPKFPGNNEGILISIRNPSLMSIPLVEQSKMYGFIINLVSFLRKQYPEDKVRILCHDHRDIQFAASIPGVEYLYPGDIYTYLALLQKCKLNVSFRLHAVLPCLSFGTPVISLVYDERGINVLDTLGMGNWSIDIIKTENIMKEIKNRISRLNELQHIRSKAKIIWDSLYELNIKIFNNFVSDVVAYKKGVI